MTLWQHIHDMKGPAYAEMVERANARIAALEAALKPFADLAHKTVVDDAWQHNCTLDLSFKGRWKETARVDPADIKNAARVLRVTR